MQRIALFFCDMTVQIGYGLHQSRKPDFLANDR
jgi:hypothetical protein